GRRDGGEGDRWAVPGQGRRLLSRGRRVGTEGERAPCAQCRRQGLGLCRLVVDRPRAGDRLRPDRGGRAGSADARHQGRLSRLDRLRGRWLRLLQLALGGDWRQCHRGGGPAASRGPPNRRRPAARLGCADDAITIEAGTVRGGDGRSLALGDLAGLSAEAAYESNKRTYSYGAHAAHVAVDPKTGHVELVDYVAVEDVGRIINPL